MPDKKLTDNEIIKALECCASGEVEECKNCPYVEGYPYCDGPMERDVLDLINRLQAENERLFLENQKLISVMLWGNKKDKKNLLKQIKAEAYKEFAELVQGEIDDAIHSNYNAKTERMSKPNVDMADEFISYCEGKIHALSGLSSYVDNTLIELVGEDK
jgi:hypothetical protein